MEFVSDDLTQIDGIRGNTVEVLHEIGIQSIDSLAFAEISQLSQDLSTNGNSFSEKEVGSWVHDAITILKDKGSATKTGLYQEILQHFQNGEWEICERKIIVLLEIFPDEKDLLQFKADVEVRSALHSNERGEIKKERSSRIQSRTIRVLLALAVITALGYFGFTYGSTLLQDLETARIERAQSAEQEEISSLLNSAEDYIKANRPIDALAILDEILAQKPDYPGISPLIDSAQSLIQREEIYNQAVRLLEDNQFNEASALFQEILAEDPLYRDVQTIIQEIGRMNQFLDLANTADLAYDQSLWEEAISGYEEALSFGLDVPTQEISENLYYSYLQQILSLLIKDDVSVDDIETAETYYLRSRSLRPQNRATQDERATLRKAVNSLLVDKYILLARSLVIGENGEDINLPKASAYLKNALAINSESEAAANLLDLIDRYDKAYINMLAGAYSEAIPDLEFIFNTDPEFADGLIVFMMYEAYTRRAENEITRGYYIDSLGSFQRAEILALFNPNARLMQAQARFNVALTLGKLGQFSEAARLYQDGVENFGFFTLADSLAPELVIEIQIANSYMLVGDFRGAYFQYVRLVDDMPSLYSFYVLIISAKEPLIPLAHEYQTTIQALLLTNDLPDQMILGDDIELHIPYLENTSGD